MTADKKNPPEDLSTLARNRKAYHDFEILESMECGIELRGTEVKSCRLRSLQLQEAYAMVERGELLLYGLFISPYSHGNRFNHAAVRPRRLLAHKKEILKLANRVKTRGFSLIPLSVYLKHGKVKIQLGIARGKTFGDKREDLRKKQDSLDARRALGARRSP